MIFKAPNNDTCLSDEPIEGWVEIDQSELEAIYASRRVVPDPSIALLTQIESMERQQIMPRATREFMLMFMEMNAPAEVLAVNPGYQAVKAFDNEIVALRAQLP